MKKILLLILLTSIGQWSFGQVTLFDMPAFHQGKNRVFDGGYANAPFFELNDTIYCITKLTGKPAPKPFHIYRVDGNQLVNVDSFSANSGGSSPGPGYGEHPYVQVIGDTAYFSTVSDFFKWSDTLIEDTTIRYRGTNPNGVRVNFLTKSVDGKLMAMYDDHYAALYHAGSWTYDTIRTPEIWEFKRLEYDGDTMYAMGRMNIMKRYDTTKVFSFTPHYRRESSGFVTNPHAMLPYNGGVFFHQREFYVGFYDGDSGDIFSNTIYFDRSETNRFWHVHDLVLHQNKLWAAAKKTEDQEEYELYVLEDSMWYNVNNIRAQHFYTVGNQVFFDGEIPGMLDSIALVQGNVYYDKNGNCTLDTLDEIIDAVVHVDQLNKPIRAIKGKYTFIGIPGETYIVQPDTHYLASGFVCRAGIDTIYVAQGDTSYKSDFILEKDTTLPDLSVSLSSFPLIRGRTRQVNALITNHGETSFDSVTLKVYLDGGLSIVSSSYAYTANEDTVCFELGTISAGVKHNVDFKMHVDTSWHVGDTLCISAEHLSVDSFDYNDVDTLCKIVLGPHDPNFKESFPSEKVLEPIEKIDYTIHFQNLGTSDAVNVTIVDSLDLRMPVAYIRVTGTSHPESYNLRVRDNVLYWDFIGIDLPPKEEDEAKSMGYVAYEAVVKEGFSNPGDRLTNKAYIYFDFEDAIITNTAIVELDEHVFGGWPLPDSIENEMVCYPNPFLESFCVTGIKPDTEYTLYNSFGQAVKRGVASQGQQIQVSQELAPGLYILSVNGVSFKLIKM